VADRPVGGPEFRLGRGERLPRFEDGVESVGGPGPVVVNEIEERGADQLGVGPEQRYRGVVGRRDAPVRVAGHDCHGRGLHEPSVAFALLLDSALVLPVVGHVADDADALVPAVFERQ